MKSIAALAFLTFGCATLVAAAHEADGELMNVQFLFRHGDRAPKSMYKKDPYKDFVWPDGLSQLTSMGKERMYHYGKIIHQKYANYIEHTKAKNVAARSSPAKRCLESTQVFLAGLMPPKKTEIWSHNQNGSTDELSRLWQPIAVESTDMDSDFMLSPSAICYEATMLELKMYVDPKVQKLLHDNEDFLEQLSHHSGMHFRTPLDAFKLLDTILCEQYFFGKNFIKPKWIDEMGNNTLGRLEKLTNEAMKLVYGVSPVYLRLRAGTFLKDMLSNFNKATHETKIDEHNRRVHAYGTHDSVIATILLALGFFKEPPSFGSGLIFELRKDSHQIPQVHLYYSNVTNNFDIYPLKLNESSQFSKLCHSAHCALKDFEASLHQFVPEDLKKECEHKSTN